LALNWASVLVKRARTALVSPEPSRPTPSAGMPSRLSASATRPTVSLLTLTVAFEVVTCSAGESTK
jgi:hypothetical protein